MQKKYLVNLRSLASNINTRNEGLQRPETSCVEILLAHISYWCYRKPSNDLLRVRVIDRPAYSRGANDR